MCNIFSFFLKVLLTCKLIYAIIITQSVMLFLFYFMEVVQMKYEMPTCEIVLLEQVDCDLITISNIVRETGNDSPLIIF